MILPGWIYLIGALIITVGIGLLWFFIGQTPMRFMIAITIRYRLIRLVDWFRAIGRAQVRIALVAKHSYEELFDTMLVIRALNHHYENEVGLKWADLMAEEGVMVSRDLTELFLSYPEEVLSAVSLHLFEDRFRASSTPNEIYDFLRAEQHFLAENPDESLEHPNRLWRRFGRGAIYGWRTPFYFAK